MGILSSIRAYFGRYNARRSHYRTESLLRSLPAEVQRDIGWPGIGYGLDAVDPHSGANGRWR